MFRLTIRLFSINWLLPIFALTLILGSATSSRAQRARAVGAEEGQEAEPMFADFKGVRIGTLVAEARKKLGNPRDKGEEQDLFVPNDDQAIQVFYDKKGAVSAISIDFMGGHDAPSAQEVLGTKCDRKADGSMYKMIRYPKAGYWVSYSRTAGDSPTVTITMQKIEP